MGLLTSSEAAFYDSFKNGEAIETTVIAGKLVAIKHPFARLAPKLERPGIMGLLGDEVRIGVAWLQRYLEMHYFQPYTTRGEIFEVYRLRWMDLTWALTLFPAHAIARATLNEALELAGLVGRQGQPSVARSDHPPLETGTIPSPERHYFAMGFVEMDLPLDNVLFLENRPGHLIYRDPRKAYELEAARMRELEAEWDACRFDERAKR